MEIGNKLWCIRASMESDGYSDYGDAGPVKPWQGMITNIRQDAIFLSYFNEKGVVDTDTNATAVCSQNELYENREDAAKAFATKAIEKAEALEAEANELRKLATRILLEN